MFEKWAFDWNVTIFGPWTGRENKGEVNTSIKLCHPSASTSEHVLEHFTSICANGTTQWPAVKLVDY